jgi:hypothetical protein
MTAILLIHAITSRSPQFALFFWLSGGIMALMREIAMSTLSGLQGYGDFTLKIGTIPLIMLLLWPNLIYISWEWANNFLRKEYFHEQNMGQHAPLIFITMVFASILFESLFYQFDLIHWNVDPIVPFILGIIPMLAPFTYGFTAVVFMKSFKLLWNLPNQTRSVMLSKLILIQPVNILIIMGLLLITNLLIVLVFS